MAIQFNNTNIRRKTPITRNTKFFSPEDVRLQVELANEYIRQWMNQTIILYEVDLDRTKVNDIYKEANSGAIRFRTPVELPVIYEIEDAELKSYETNINKGVYSKVGKLKFSILISTLEEFDCDIHRGDYIGVQIDTEHREYFTVTDDGRVDAMANKNTLFGTVPYMRDIECSPISDYSEFNG